MKEYQQLEEKISIVLNELDSLKKQLTLVISTLND